MPPARTDVAVVGGGIVGLAVARAAAQLPSRPHVVVVEKESVLAAHQTGRNSGVLHSGIYYKPGSLKARTATAGRAAMVAFCQERGIAHEVCGKVVVATDESEHERLAQLEQRGLANGLGVRRISLDELHEREPHVTGTAALFVPETGIADFRAVTEALASDVRAMGGEVVLGTPVTSLDERGPEARVGTTGGQIAARVVVNCAGLHSDRVAAMHGVDDGTRIVPFRGEYYELAPRAQHLVRNLVYPVPDPAFPFLGVHFTRMIHGGVHAGPNAVLALAREGYRWRDVDRHDLAEVVRNRAVWRLARRHWRTGAGEVARSLSKRAFVRALRRLVPELIDDDLVRASSGVRAQALGADGTLLDDFAIRHSQRIIDVVNAPSPAATASLEIASVITGLVSERLR